MAQQLFFPYRFGKHEIRLRVPEVLVDGAAVDSLVDYATRSIGLRDQRDWDEVVLKIRAHIDPGRITHLFPEDERPDPPCTMTLAVHCHDTRWRASIPMSREEGSPEWTGEMRLNRRAVRGIAYLSAYLLRTTDRTEPVASFASSKNVRVASSGDWRIRLDKSELPPGGYLDVRWERFSTSDFDKLNAYPRRVFYLDYDHDPPVIFLNEEVEGLRNILESEATRGTVAAVRETVFGAVTQVVWLSLAMQSLLSIPPDEQQPENEWQQNVLARLQPLMHDAPNPADLVRNHHQAGTLVESLTAAAVAQEEFDRDVRKLISEASA